MKRRKIQPPNFTPAMGAYSHGMAVELGAHAIVFVTGQIAVDAEGAVVAPNDAAAQTEFIFKNIQTILAAADASLDDVVKAQIFVTDIKDFSKISPIRNLYFAKSEPVSTLVEVRNLVKEGCVVEIEVIAMIERLN
ncbi:MAG: RidA family protein [Alphaproteobacteria bacterium]|nr:RidA family protein [Alphaproteobacteria bacterium]